MNIIRTIIIIAAAAAALCACDDSVSYAELLAAENKNVNNFLADQTVCLDIPADTIFETGPDAPYYRLTEDGDLYMQVLKAGTGKKAVYDQQIYFRYTRYELAEYTDGKLPVGTGNNTALQAMWFRYNNFQLASSYNNGVGIQRPLAFLPIDCEVNLVVKSTMGTADDQASGNAYLYRLTYQEKR